MMWTGVIPVSPQKRSNYFVGQSLSAIWDSKMEFSDYAQGGRNGGSIEKRIH
jgi:hypothetical protein